MASLEMCDSSMFYGNLPAAVDAILLSNLGVVSEHLHLYCLPKDFSDVVPEPATQA